MNLFQLVFKQMRQRALSTWLTLLSVLLGVGLAVVIMILRRGSAQLFVQSDFGYEMIVGAPQSSPLNLVLNSAYHLGVSSGVISYQLYDDMTREFAVKGRPFFGRQVKIAVPFMVGDSHQGRRIVGTSPAMFGFDDDGDPLAGYDEHGHLVKGFENPDLRESERDPKKPLAATTFEYRLGRKYFIAQGRCMRSKRFEAVVGSDTAEKLRLKLYDPNNVNTDVKKLAAELKREPTHEEVVDYANLDAGGAFKATHGFPGPNEKPDIHKPIWRIVGILEPTKTANDRVLFVPIVSLYAIEEHEKGLIDQAIQRANIDPRMVKPDEWPAVLQKLGFDPEKLPPSAIKELQKKGIKTDSPTATPSITPSTTNTSSANSAAVTGASSKPIEVRASTAIGAEKKADDDDDEDAYHLDPKTGEIVPDLPQEEWRLNAILIRTRAGNATGELFDIMRVGHPEAQAVSPASVMREFFETFFSTSTQILLIITVLVIIVAAVGILVSIYNSISARMREIAILRALGATRGKVLLMICVEAGLIGLFGGICGLLVGHASGAVASYYFDKTIGQGIDWLTVSFSEPWYANEPLYLVFVTLLAALAGLVPALKAYRSPVATNLVAA